MPPTPVSWGRHSQTSLHTLSTCGQSTARCSLLRERTSPHTPGTCSQSHTTAEVRCGTVQHYRHAHTHTQTHRHRCAQRGGPALPPQTAARLWPTYRQNPIVLQQQQQQNGAAERHVTNRARRSIVSTHGRSRDGDQRVIEARRSLVSTRGLKVFGPDTQKLTGWRPTGHRCTQESVSSQVSTHRNSRDGDVYGLAMAISRIWGRDHGRRVMCYQKISRKLRSRLIGLKLSIQLRT